MVDLFPFVVVVAAVLFWGLRTQLQARDADARRRNPKILRALTRSELDLVASGVAVNDIARGREIGTVGMETVETLTTREEREQCAILFGLGRTLTECAEGLELELVRDPKAEGRFAAQVIDDKLVYRPGLERQAMVEACGEALRRADVPYTEHDARTLAAELVACPCGKRNIAQH